MTGGKLPRLTIVGHLRSAAGLCFQEVEVAKGARAIRVNNRMFMNVEGKAFRQIVLQHAAHRDNNVDPVGLLWTAELKCARNILLSGQVSNCSLCRFGALGVELLRMDRLERCQA